MVLYICVYMCINKNMPRGASGGMCGRAGVCARDACIKCHLCMSALFIATITAMVTMQTVTDNNINSIRITLKVIMELSWYA